MLSFPSRNWRVRHLADMASLSFAAPEDNTVRLDALLAIRPAAGEEGSSRFTLAGSKHVDMLVPLELVLDDPSFKGMLLDAQMELGTQVRIQ